MHEIGRCDLQERESITLTDAAGLREAVRSHYAEAARVASERDCAVLQPGRASRLRQRAVHHGRAREPAGGVGARQPRVREPDGGRIPRRGRGGARPRQRRRDRCPPQCPPRRSQRKGLRPGHDRGDARAGAKNTAEAGIANVECLKGVIEAIPLPADTVDVVISNCVINLSTDKPTVIAEMFRVLTPGGRIGVATSSPRTG